MNKQNHIPLSIKDRDIYGVIQDAEFNQYLDPDTIDLIYYFNSKMGSLRMYIKDNNLTKSQNIINEISNEIQEFKNESKIILNIINSTFYPLIAYYYSKKKDILNAKSFLKKGLNCDKYLIENGFYSLEFHRVQLAFNYSSLSKNSKEIKKSKLILNDLISYIDLDAKKKCIYFRKIKPLKQISEKLSNQIISELKKEYVKY